MATPVALPLVGRDDELSMLQAALDAAGQGRGSTVFLCAEGGTGKTRLVATLLERATKAGWSTTIGRAYPVETGVPYALFSDALLPVIRRLEPSTLQVLTRGGSAELAHLFPALGPTPSGAADRAAPAEFKARLYWNAAQFLGRLAAKGPVLIALENLQWADASSLELLHFVGRQLEGHRLLFVCTYNDAERAALPALRSTEQSLVSLGVARAHRLAPLPLAAVESLVRHSLGAARGGEREFAALLYGWTRGNAFFVEETLKALADSGRVRVSADGRLGGWDPGDLGLPPSVRAAVEARLERLSSGARALADLAAVVGTRADYDEMAAVSGMSEPELVSALEELIAQRVLVEGDEQGRAVYDFAHPLVQDAVYRCLGRARARILHGTVADALERRYASRTGEHAGVLAFHYSRGAAAASGAGASKALAYLTAAGRSALGKYANREAADYLTAALAHADGLPAGSAAAAEVTTLVEELAQARQRLGEYEAATSLWRRARDEAASASDHPRLAAIERRMGLACYWSGRHADALAHYDRGLAAAAAAGSDSVEARLRLAKGMCLQALGRSSDAQTEVRRALAVAEKLGDPALLARAHRALLLLYVWTGPSERAHEHGNRAIELAEAAGQRTIAWSSHWAMAVLKGLTSDAAGVARHLAEAERLADDLRSPVLRLWTAEVAIEYAAGTGDWEVGLSIGASAIATARALSQRALLPRLLVWTGLIHLGRGSMETAKEHFDEAWELSGAGNRSGSALDVHTVVPAHTGMASYYTAIGDYRRAIEIGDAGLRVADDSGSVAWAIYRLLPVATEAALWLEDFPLVERYSSRLRRESSHLGHPLGLAWAGTADALVAMLRKDYERAVPLLRASAEALDAVPFVFDAARLRTRLALALTELGDTAAATRELRRAHEAFASMGAERALGAARAQLRALGARPPSRGSGPSAAGLTGRELDIARLVADRKSNKEIGIALDISPRTVSTHLSNIFAKLGVDSRGALTDVVRGSGMISATNVP